VSAWVVRHGFEEPVEIDIGPAMALEECVKEHLAEVGRPALGDLVALRGVGASAGTTDEAGARLRQLLWEPLALHLGGVETVIVSPDRFLGALPFETLPLDGDDVLLERYG
jgi:hypothetical protein